MRFPVQALGMVLLMLGACGDSNTASEQEQADLLEEEQANSLEGAWQRIRFNFVYPDTTVTGEEGNPPSIKILTPTHFAFGRQTEEGEDVFSGGGRYSLDEDQYTEHIEYHSDIGLVGESIPFDYRLEGDLWYHSGQIGEMRLEEVWRRLE